MWTGQTFWWLDYSWPIPVRNIPLMTWKHNNLTLWIKYFILKDDYHAVFYPCLCTVFSCEVLWLNEFQKIQVVRVKVACSSVLSDEDLPASGASDVIDDDGLIDTVTIDIRTLILSITEALINTLWRTEMSTGYTLPSRSNLPFCISDIRALWRSALSARVPECQKLKMQVRPGWH